MGKNTQKMAVRRLSDMTPDPHNANRGTERGAGMLEASLRQYGAGRSLLVDKHGVVIAGNKTLEAAASVGLDDVVVVQTDGTKLVVVQRTDLDLASDPRAKALGVADNRVAQVGLDWDAQVLQDLVAEGADLGALFSDKELAELVARQFKAQDGLTDPDDVPDPPANAVTQRGDVWKLGRHRVMCGDSTSADDIARLVDGARMDLCVTSPPYGAAKVAKLRDHYVKGADTRKSFYDEHVDDPESWPSLMMRWFAAVRPVCECVVCNVQMLADNKRALVAWLDHYADDLCDVIVWDKGHGAPQMQANVLSNAFEFCFVFGGNSSRAIPFASFHGTLSNVVRIDPRGKNDHADKHRAVFPVELPTWVMASLCPLAGTVIDPFCGSGTTLIAAEQLGRTCYGMELSPQYCDVIVDRWEQFTGQKAERVTDAGHQ